MQTNPQMDEAPAFLGVAPQFPVPVERVDGMREVIVEDCHVLRLAFGEDPGRAAKQGDLADRSSAGR